MTKKTKLEIIGPYTPEHEGPFCTRDGRTVRVLCKDRVGDKPIIGLVHSEGYDDFILELTEAGRYRGEDLDDSRYDLMCAREVPVAREFWVNEYTGVVPKNAVAHRSEDDAKAFKDDPSYLRTIHVREVLPGEDE